MARATEVAKGMNTVVQVVKLPEGLRTRTSYTFTTTAAVAANDTTIAIAAAPVKKFQGDKLTFGSVTVTLAADLTLGATSISIAPASGIIASGATATDYGMRVLSTADKANLSLGGKTVDTSSFGDGLYSEFVKIQIDATLQLSGVYAGTNPAMTEVIIPCSNSPRELYFIITDEDGVSTSGAAVIESYSENIVFRDIKRWEATLKVLGATETRNAAGDLIG